ncbi:MAG: serine/threonine-protein kinase, partial [Bacteroidota bacterium]
MTADRWTRITTLVDAALDLPPGGRAAFLDTACADDPSLRREVEDLLDADTEADAFLEARAARDVERLMAHLNTPEPLERIGPYRMLRVLGQGGMGTVYLAERADGLFEQRVAIKVMQPQHIAHLDRFRLEQQVLARLSHPHIARLYDGGLTPKGAPYIIMEYVDGRPITDFATQRRLATDERVVLLLRVCDAVQYAHRHLVIHRDLKPSNVLVTDEGQVKLLDFGIAKLMSDEATTITQAASPHTP